MGRKPEKIKRHKIAVIPYDENTEANAPVAPKLPVRGQAYKPPKRTKPQL
tara:strand:+ start:2970 stop:3119 length:150 start_codon:yes stop_codon:yes gene_type:complete